MGLPLFVSVIAVSIERRICIDDSIDTGAAVHLLYVANTNEPSLVRLGEQVVDVFERGATSECSGARRVRYSNASRSALPARSCTSLPASIAGNGSASWLMLAKS